MCICTSFLEFTITYYYYGHHYPTWASLARDYLAVMASSASSEQAFSVAGKLFLEKGNITVVVICVNMIPQQNVCRCFSTLGYEPWLELGPGLSQPEALQKAQAWIRSSLSRSKPGHSRGFQAKPGLHITNRVHLQNVTYLRALAQG